jgi:hypothetical protein
MAMIEDPENAQKVTTLLPGKFVERMSCKQK